MREFDDNGAPWSAILDELHRMRVEAAQREEEIWDAVDEIRRMVSSRDDAHADVRRNGSQRDNHRLDPARYRALKRRLKRFVMRSLPEGGHVAVVSRGDDELLDLPGCATEHFPRSAGGEYLGWYPRDGIPAIAHFEWARSAGAEYLLFPETARWWLDKFPRFASYLASRHAPVAEEEGVGVLYALQRDRDGVGACMRPVQETLDAWEEHTGASPCVLDWGTGLELSARLSGRTVFTPPRSDAPLPYLDETVDVVAVAGDDPFVLAEARRVARRTVIRFESAGADVTGRSPESLLPVVEHRTAAPPSLPSVSVVVPTYDGIDHLVPCLRALEETLPSSFSGEVLVVDDASGAKTALALDRLERVYPWLRVIRNETNAGFIMSCNRGAQEARGDFLVFLNDDTVPLSGWLEALLRVFRTRPDAGAVGGRLVYPDGRLQEAGGVIFDDASGANFGRGDDDVDAPLYTYVRPVHYCSGALLATPRELFLEVGGFDLRYCPAYYEDTDYCFSVRARGLEVYYQPESVVIHVEGATSGTDTSSGAKRYQVRNRGIFRKKWREELSTLRSAPGAYSSRTWHGLALHGGAP